MSIFLIPLTFSFFISVSYLQTVEGADSNDPFYSFLSPTSQNISPPAKDITYIVKNNTNFLINLTSGDKSIYERKAKWGILEWGDETIPINGYVKNVTNKQSKENQIVKIQVLQGDTLIHQTYLKADGDGYYNASLYPPNDGTVTVKAILVSQDPWIETSITVVATQAWMPAILITIFISLTIFFAVLFWSVSKSTNDGKWLKIGLVPLIITNVLTYIILYKFPPFDTAANGAIAAALIAPVGIYIFDMLRKE